MSGGREGGGKSLYLMFNFAVDRRALKNKVCLIHLYSLEVGMIGCTEELDMGVRGEKKETK